MKRSIVAVALLVACDQKRDEVPRPATCLDYATALLGECFDAVRTAEKSDLQCDSGLLEAGYNACNLALEAEQRVCVPYRASSGRSANYTATHGCSAYVDPPAPKNWRGATTTDADRAEREP